MRAYFRYWCCVFSHSHHISCVCCWRYTLNVNESVRDILTSTASPRSASESALHFSQCVSIKPFLEGRSVTFPGRLFLSLKQGDLNQWSRTSFPLIYSGDRGDCSGDLSPRILWGWQISPPYDNPLRDSKVGVSFFMEYRARIYSCCIW